MEAIQDRRKFIAIAAVLMASAAAATAIAVVAVMMFVQFFSFVRSYPGTGLLLAAVVVIFLAGLALVVMSSLRLAQGSVAFWKSTTNPDQLNDAFRRLGQFLRVFLVGIGAVCALVVSTVVLVLRGAGK